MKHWTTKAGNQVPLADLETSHLKNIISMLRRKGFVSLEEFHASCAAAASSVRSWAQETSARWMYVRHAKKTSKEAMGVWAT